MQLIIKDAVQLPINKYVLELHLELGDGDAYDDLSLTFSPDDEDLYSTISAVMEANKYGIDDNKWLRENISGDFPRGVNSSYTIDYWHLYWYDEHSTQFKVEVVE